MMMWFVYILYIYRYIYIYTIQWPLEVDVIHDLLSKHDDDVVCIYIVYIYKEIYIFIYIYLY